MLSDSTARIIINDSMTDPFPIRRGVKQGDPISPLLFNIIIEILNKQSTKIKGFQIDEANNLKILMFADDIVLFGDSHEELEEWLNILESFSKATGLTLNQSKSFYYEHEPDKQLKNLPRLQPEDVFQYLGFTLNSHGLINNSRSLP